MKVQFRQRIFRMLAVICVLGALVITVWFSPLIMKLVRPRYKGLIVPTS